MHALHMGSNQKIAAAIEPFTPAAAAPLPQPADEGQGAAECVQAGGEDADGKEREEGGGAEERGLAGWLAKASSLTTLDLSNCKLGDKGVKALASALAQNENDSLVRLVI